MDTKDDAATTLEDVINTMAQMTSPEDEYLAGVVDGLPSLAGKCYAITGCTSGTGWHAAVVACQKGAACLIMANRPSERATKAEADLAAIAGAEGTRVVTVACDLQSFASVSEAGPAIAAIASEFGGLDGLICNAGIMGVPDKRTADGYDVQMQTNHLSHFLLTQLLMASLEQAADARGEARVCQHSSGARGNASSGRTLKAEYFEKSEAGGLGGDGIGACFGRYFQTKLANPVFAMALHEKLKAKGSKVKSLCAEPGVAGTDLVKNLAQLHMANGADVGFLLGMLKNFSCVQTPADGACSIIVATFGDGANSGDFYMPGSCLDKNREPHVDGTVRGVPVKTLAGGAPNAAAPEWIRTRYEGEGDITKGGSHALLWSASEAATGEFTL